MERSALQSIAEKDEPPIRLEIFIAITLHPLLPIFSGLADVTHPGIFYAPIINATKYTIAKEKPVHS